MNSVTQDNCTVLAERLRKFATSFGMSEPGITNSEMLLKAADAITTFSPPPADMEGIMDGWPDSISDGLVLACSDCGTHPRFDYTVTDEFWAQHVSDKARHGVVCLPCLDRRCGGVGLANAVTRVQWTGTGHTVVLSPTLRHVYAAGASNTPPADMEGAVRDLAEKIIAGLRRESERPFSGFAYGPIEAVEKLRDQVIGALPALQRTEITDDMCRRAIDAMKADRIQGFSTPRDERRSTWGPPHWVRDILRPHDDQELWRGDSHDEMIERCRIEEMRLALRAALPAGQRTPPDGWKTVPIELTEHMRDVAWGLIQGNLRPDEIWKYMVEAAPAAPVVADDRSAK